MNAALAGGILVLALPACAGYTQRPNPKNKRSVWDRPDAAAFKILPSAFTIHSATTSVILVRVPGDPTSLACADAGKDFHLGPVYCRERTTRLGQCPAKLGATK